LPFAEKSLLTLAFGKLFYLSELRFPLGKNGGTNLMTLSCHEYSWRESMWSVWIELKSHGCYLLMSLLPLSMEVIVCCEELLLSCSSRASTKVTGLSQLIPVNVGTC
jgi:hypothetical protein